jgi:hypothetical protein
MNVFAKLRCVAGVRWREGLVQSYRYRYFCDCSIVVLPSDVAERAAAERRGKDSRKLICRRDGQLAKNLVFFFGAKIESAGALSAMNVAEYIH